MADIRLRPRFRVQVDCTSQELLSTIDRELRVDSDDVRAVLDGAVYASSAVLRIPADRQHYWSPELQVGVEDDGPGAVVTGIFGPRPAVWSMFVALYAFLAFVALMGSAYAAAQLTMQAPAYAFWIVPATLVAAIAVYVAGRVGRSLGQAQMSELREFLDAAIGMHTDPDVLD